MSSRIRTQQAEQLRKRDADRHPPTEHISDCNNPPFVAVGFDDVRFGTVVTEECPSCGHRRHRVDHDRSIQFDVTSRTDQLLDRLHTEFDGPDGCYCLEHVAYMVTPYGNLVTEGEARKYANERVGGVNGDFRVRQLSRPAVFCLFETRTENVVASNLIPSEYALESDTHNDPSTIEEAVERQLNPMNHEIYAGANQDARFAPEDYSGTHLEWLLDRIESLELRLQTADVKLD